MFHNLFTGIFDRRTTTVISVPQFLLCVGVSLLIGVILAAAYAYKTRYNPGFVRTLAILPAVVCVVIMMVNGNVGTGVAVAGAYAPVQAPIAAPAAAPAPVQAAAADSADAGDTDYTNSPNAVKSPMVGVVYLSADPTSPNYVKPGDTVAEGDTVCLVEAMKTFNPVKAHKGGKVVKILVETGDPVEYGEPLVVIE